MSFSFVNCLCFLYTRRPLFVIFQNMTNLFGAVFLCQKLIKDWTYRGEKVLWRTYIFKKRKEKHILRDFRLTCLYVSFYSEARLLFQYLWVNASNRIFLSKSRYIHPGRWRWFDRDLYRTPGAADNSFLETFVSDLCCIMRLFQIYILLKKFWTEFEWLLKP